MSDNRNWTKIVESTILSALAIISITILEYTALNCGINGTNFSLAIAAISGLGGYYIAQILKETQK